MSRRKPLFSRQQLNWIIIVLSAVIALLSLTAKESPWPSLTRTPIGAVDLLSPLEGDHERPLLRLSLLLPPYLNADAPQAATLERLLLGQLQQPAPVTGLVHQQRQPDRLRLTLRLDRGDTFEALTTRLLQPPDPQLLAQEQRRLTAALRLGDDKPTPWPRHQEQATDLAALYRNWISRQQLRLIASAPLTPAQQQALATALQRWPTGTPWPQQVPAAAAASLRHTADNTPRLQLLRTLPGRTHPDYEATQLAVLLLRPTAAALDIQLDWQPRRHASRLMLTSNRGQQLDAEALLAQLRHATPRDDASLDAAVQELEQRLRRQLEQPQTRLDLLESIAVYGLPLDALARFAATMADLKPTQLAAQLDALLQPNHFVAYTQVPLSKENSTDGP